MRIKILLLGDDPVSLMADEQVLRERGMLVFTTFNLDNISEAISELQPNLIFFDPKKPNIRITEVYNNIVNDIYHTNIPIVFSLSEDDVYLVTRKRTESKEKRNVIADNMVDAIKMALRSRKTYHKKTGKVIHPTRPFPTDVLRA